MKLLIAGLVAALSLNAVPAMANKADNVLNAAFSVQLPSLDPYYIGGNEGALLGRLVFDGLVYRDPVTFEIQPLIATKWTLVDPLTWDFDIREGVKFSNGDPLTAEDVAYSLNFASNPESGTFSPQSAAWIKSAEALGPLKVRIHSKVPTPTALEYLRSIYIVPAKYHKESGKEKFGLAPIGSGPYTVERGQNNAVIFKANELYMEGGAKNKPLIPTLIYKAIPDSNTQLAELISGGVDWMWQVSDDQVKMVKPMPNIQVISAATRRIAFITLDAAGDVDPKSPLTDLRVRQAINYAIDRESISKNLIGGASHRINATCTPTQLGCTDDVVHYDFDQAKAKELLKEAGYADGFETEIYAYRSQPVAGAIINYLNDVGIKANLHWMQYPAVVKARREHQTPMVIDDFSSGGSSDAGFGLSFYFRNAPDDQSHDPIVTDAVTKGVGIMDDDERRATYEIAVKRTAEQAYWVPLFTMPLNFAMSADLVWPDTRDESIEFWKYQWK
jgi:peptide/nickel transport system substrate-binding protein